MAYLIVSLFCLLLSFLWYSLCPICYLLITFSVVIFALCLVLWAHFSLSSPHQTPTHLLDNIEKKLIRLRLELKNKKEQCEEKTKNKLPYLPVIFGRTVDSLLQQLIDLILRDFFNVWIKLFLHNPESSIELIKKDIWCGISILHERLCKIDRDKLLANDIVGKITLHLEKIRISQAESEELNQQPLFFLSPHLINKEAELNYLRNLTELLITMLLPQSYSMPPMLYFIREVFVCKVLYPVIELVTEPDYINMKIIEHIEALKELAAMHNKTYEYAKTFEDYIKLINNCENIDALKQLRYEIMSQIMQATTLQNIKRAKGIDIEEIDKGNCNTQQLSKQEVVAARRLKRYMAQLSIAKTECEKALVKLGWDGLYIAKECEEDKTLSLRSILESGIGRRKFSLFLETMCSQELVGFWSAVEELRNSPQSNWHQLGADIFYTYIRSPISEVKVDKEIRKRMEAFLMGDSGPEVFYQVQDTVYTTLHHKYYPSFILSEHYKVMLKEMENEQDSDVHEDNSPSEEFQLSTGSVSPCDSIKQLDEHSTYARKKLQQLEEKHNNKTQALAALQASLKPDSGALRVLAHEMESLATERARLHAHLVRTDTWAAHLGSWRATIHSAEVLDESKPVQFVIVVHMDENVIEDNPDKPEGITTGWVLLRSLPEFQELHNKLRPLCSELKNLELPSNTFKFIFGKNDRNSLEKTKQLIQKYLEFILKDERLNQSEALYAFLNPISEHNKHSSASPKKSRFSLSTLFKSNSENTSRSSQERENCSRMSADEDEISLYLDGDNGETIARAISVQNKGGVLGVQLGVEDRDTIAEPLYTLLSEVFDMQGVFKWLRRTLITFVQIAYGSNINRQIRDTVSWLFSEKMLHYYINVVIKSWWPGGVFSLPQHNPKPEDREARKRKVSMLLLSNIPDVLCSIVGSHTARRGVHKLLHVLQLHTHNKQLLYEIVDLIIIEVFPELKKYT